MCLRDHDWATVSTLLTSYWISQSWLIILLVPRSPGLKRLRIEDEEEDENEEEHLLSTSFRTCCDSSLDGSSLVVMRITGGKAARQRLKVPKGLEVRPTPDLVKQAVFNSLGTRTLGARVLELFAGTGALSLEALSRGAVS